MTRHRSCVVSQVVLKACHVNFQLGVQVVDLRLLGDITSTKRLDAIPEMLLRAGHISLEGSALLPATLCLVQPPSIGIRDASMFIIDLGDTCRDLIALGL